MRLVIVSGRSGSGKTVALHALEDLGFYCIDNLPISFLPELKTHVPKSHAYVAISIDVRNIPSGDLETFKSLLDGFKGQSKTPADIIYLDADENTLLQRFSETRRKHPLSNDKTSLREAIRKEHELLTPIADLADLTIDTSPLTRQTLYNLIRNRVALDAPHTQIQLLLQSFGFKHGLPPDADFVFDIRCLPNPYWNPELRGLSGKDNLVCEFLESLPDVRDMLKEIASFLEHWIPRFQADNRSYLSIAIGCTGGQHRSVYMVERLAEVLRKKLPNIQVRHRELFSHIGVFYERG